MPDVFGNTQVGALTEPARPTPAPTANQSALVVDNSSDIKAQAIGQGLGAVLGIGAKILDEKKATADASAVRGFINEQLAIADGVDAGDFDSQAGRVRSRAAFRKFVAANPKLAGEALKAQKELVGTAGLGKVIAEGTNEEKVREKSIQDAVTQGWLPGDIDKLTDGEIEDGLNNMQQARRATQELAKLKRETETTGIVRKQDVRVALGKIGESSHNRMLVRFKELDRAVVSGQMTPEEAAHAVSIDFADIDSKVAIATDGELADYAGKLVQPSKDLGQAYIDKWSGKSSSERLARSVQDTLNKATLAFYNGNPKALRIAVVTKTIGKNIPPQLAASIVSTGVDILSDFIDGKTTPVLDGGGENVGAGESKREQVDLVGKVISNSIAKFESELPEDKEAAKQEISTVLNTYAKSVVASESLAETASDFNNVMKFFSNPLVGKFIEEQGGIQAKNLEAAKQVVQRSYQQKVIPLIKSEISKRTTNVGLLKKNVPTMDILEPVFTGSGIMFKVKDGVVDNFTSKLQVNDQITDLNETVAPVINRLLRAGTHFEGHTDYKATWENTLAPALFGHTPPGGRNQPATQVKPKKMSGGQPITIAKPTGSL